MDLCRETLCHYSLLQNAKFWRDQIGRKIPSAKENPFPSDIHQDCISMPYTFHYQHHMTSFQSTFPFIFTASHRPSATSTNLLYPFIHLHLHILHFPLFTFLQSVKFYYPWNPQFSFQRRYRTKSKTQTEFYKNSTQVEASSCTSASTGASAETCHSGPVSWQRHAPLPQAETHIRPCLLYTSDAADDNSRV